MNKISRDNFPPNFSYQIGPNRGLQRWRVAEKRILNLFATNNASFMDGSVNFPAHPSSIIWKDELESIQGKKCCYCEKPINNGILEHYRPKKGYQQSKGDAITRPGYYWLAYRWRNILLTCTECNEANTKGNLFPITGNRATTPTAELDLEDAQLINPYEEEPNKSISFHRGDPISFNQRGRTTIDILDLKNRADLAPIRNDRFFLYANAKELIKLQDSGVIEINLERITEARRLIKKATKEKSPFSGMIKENIKNQVL
jgi:hypothetical protein